MSKDENVKTIRFSVGVDDKLQKVATKNGLTKLAFFIHMVDYFYKSKKDPRDLNDELLKTELHKKTNNIVSFIKTQEQELLIPIKQDAERMITSQQKLALIFDRHILKHNEAQQATSKELATDARMIKEYLKKLDAARFDAGLLKKRFLDILEYHIKAREQMSVLTKQADKDELIKHTLEQVKYL
jgi:hypothetical protein